LGARGGLAGAPCKHFKRTIRGELVELPPLAIAELEDGERIVSITCGGGGYGPPSEREPEQVRRDVAERWISLDRAHDVYRVALNERLEVDAKKTEALRSTS
jgi:N-methylhydantoinase B